MSIEDEVLIWAKQIAETTNEKFLPLYFSKERYLILMGGGGSGKSIFAGRKLLERATSEPGHRILVCRKVAKTLRESCFEQLRKQLSDHYPHIKAEINRTDMSITLPNGSKFLFCGLDDVEKLKSIYDITGIWIEEASEITEADFNQLDIRLRTNFNQYLQMILTFNPININHWLKKRFFDRSDPRAKVMTSTYKDNRFLTDEAKATLEGFRDSDPYYYEVYCLGHWGVTGKTVFDAMALMQRRDLCPQPIKQGYFASFLEQDGIHLREEMCFFQSNGNGGTVKIFKEPVPGHPYIIGGDTAGEGSDYFVGQVLDNVTGEQVAVLHLQCDEDVYARQMFLLGRYYNDALLCIESNFSTYPNKILEKMGYKHLYVREQMDNFDGKIRHSYGFQTNSLTRPVIIAELIRVMHDNVNLINDTDTIDEMMQFIRNDKLRPEAEPGGHDDMVMALAIAFYCRPQQHFSVDGEKKDKFKGWSQDLIDDYRRATPEMKKMIEEQMNV